MAEVFQKLFTRADVEVMSLNVQAAMGPVRQPERSQLSQLMRHFLERFFTPETASPDSDAKTRMVQIACAAGLPPFMVAVFLWPIYHPVIVFRKDYPIIQLPPPFWAQVNHHFFFTMYSFVAMGLITVFEWDLFFPDLLDVFVLGTLPISQRRVFLARAGSIAIFVLGFLFDINVLTPGVLVMATDPADLGRFLAGHILAVVSGGLFAAASVLALQGVLVAALGERLFRKMSLAVQGLVVMMLVMLMLLFPVLTAVTPALLEAGNARALCFPPFWFLGIYERTLAGPSALPIFRQLANIGYMATAAAVGIALAAFPIAYVRRIRQLVEGGLSRSTRRAWLAPLHRLLHATVVRRPAMRAVFHFIEQTILRVPRYRIYLVLYGGVGLSVVVATILRFSIVGQHVRAQISADGVRAAVGIVAFWVIGGLRTAFASSGNQRGGWIFRLVHGRPPKFETAIAQLRAAKVWALLCGLAVTLATIVSLRWVEPEELLSWPSLLAQVLVGSGVCVLLTDAFFLNVTNVAFTGELEREQENLAFTVLRYFTFFPLVTGASLVAEYWAESSGAHAGITAASIVVAHLWFRKRHRDVVRLHCNQLDLEEGEEDFPMKLGLRY